MIMLAAPVHHNGCPERQTLLDFSRGRLAEPVLDALGNHLTACRSCIAILSEIQQREADEGLDARLRPFLAGGFSQAKDARPGVFRGCPISTGQGSLAENQTKRGKQLVGTRVGRYRLLEVIGAGGMGVVYRAEQVPVGLIVALKTITDSVLARPDRLARFRTEGAALARLHHPNVVQLYHFDEDDGRPYFTMELVDGVNLARRLAEGPLDFRAAAKLVRTLAEAVAFSHGEGVIHRDLKPANVLLTSDGTPKVTDFGLAMVLDEGRGRLTETDAVMGTPSYMAPEQAAGCTTEIGPRTDVYALGAIMYELLSGVPPFVADSKNKILALVQTGNVTPPSRHRKETPSDLEAVCLKCLATSQHERFSSAHELAEELGRWLDGKPTRTRRPGRWRRVVRAVRRRATALLGGIFLAGGLIGATAAILPLFLPSSSPDGESESVRRELEAGLDQGRQVTLVGETGWPKWFRWRVGKGVQRTHIEPDGTFSAEMLDQHATGLLELLPDSRTDRYKLTAQVRHDQGGYVGFVGLYVAHRTYPRQPRDIQFFTQVRFNAVTATPRVLVLPQPKERVPENHTQRMALALRLHTDRITPPNVNHVWSEAAGSRLQALGPRNGVWHDLEVTVTPDGVTATVGGNRMELYAASLKGESLQSGIEAVRQKHPEDHAVQKLRLAFSPRGGLGLVLYPLSAASIRKVTVTPLQTGQ